MLISFPYFRTLRKKSEKKLTKPLLKQRRVQCQIHLIYLPMSMLKVTELRHLVLIGKKWELLYHNSELCPLNILPPCRSRLFKIVKNKRFYRGSSLSPIRWVSARVYSVNLFICLVSNGAGFVIFLSCNICGSNSQSIIVIDATGVFCKFEEYIVHYWRYVVQNILDTSNSSKIYIDIY